MNASNFVQLLGNFGSDPEVKSTDSSKSMVVFSFATHYPKKDDHGVTQKITEWHRCVAFGGTADLIAKYMKSGSKALLNGSIQTRTYEPKPEEIKYITEVVVSEIVFLDPKSS